MLKRIQTSVLVFIVIFLTVESSKAQLSQDFDDTLSTTLNSYYNSLNIKGVSAAVFFPDGSVWSDAYGSNGSENLTVDHLYEMGSNTKTMVAAILLQLQEEGKLDLDDTLYSYIPVNENIPFGITIKQCLNHTSGLYDYTTDPGFAMLVNTNPSRFIEPQEIINDFVKEPVFAAGSNWSYCNTNFIALGLVIEAIENKEFHESFRDRFLDPMGLEHTYLDEYESYTEKRAYSWLNNGNLLDIQFTSFLSAAWAAGAIISTPSDLAEWAFYLYSGRLLEESSMDDMESLVRVGGTTYPYGLGMFRSIHRGRVYHGHGGTTLQNSTMNYSLESDFSIVVNVPEQDTYQEVNDIEKALIDIIESQIDNFNYWPLGIEDKSDVELLVYPNPVSDKLNIEIGNEFYEELNLRLFSTSGQLVYNTIFTGSSIDVSMFSPGIYILEMSNHSSGLIMHKKLIIE